MCEYLNEQDSTHAYLIERITKLEAELDDCQLRSIEARNPGIDMNEVRNARAAMREDRRCECGEFALFSSGACGPNGCFNRPA